MKTVSSEKAPKVVGPYSQAVITGDFVFCSGQVPLDPETGELIAGDIREQTNRTLQNLAGVLEAAGTDFSTVASVNIYLRSMNDFKEVNEVYAKAFDKYKPARVTIGVSELPKNALVEISCIAYLAK